MTLFGFASGRSPGLTTVVHALALVWPPPRRALIAELDPDGGSFAGRHALAPDPGLVSLAAAGRRALPPGELIGHCQQLADGTPVLLGPTSPDRAVSALATLGGRLGAALAALADFDVLADFGRLDGRSPALQSLGACRVVVLVVEPTVEGVAHLAGRLPTLPLPVGRHTLISVGDRPYRAVEVAQALKLPLLGTIARDPRGAGRLADGRPDQRGPLLRSARAIAADLQRQLDRDPEEAVGSSAEGLQHVPSTVPAHPLPAKDGLGPPAWR
jgi:hypothetical protein